MLITINWTRQQLISQVHAEHFQNKIFRIKPAFELYLPIMYKIYVIPNPLYYYNISKFCLLEICIYFAQKNVFKQHSFVKIHANFFLFKVALIQNTFAWKKVFTNTLKHLMHATFNFLKVLFEGGGLRQTLSLTKKYLSKNIIGIRLDRQASIKWMQH
jgi:hypothetical protein